MNHWEYRVHTVSTFSDYDDNHASQLLTNISLPSMPERGTAGGWEIFAVLPAGSEIRLFMKRPTTGDAG